MKRRHVLLAVLATFVAGGASAAPPSDASIDRLLTVMRAESLIDQSFTQAQQAMQQVLRQHRGSAGAAPLNEAQQRIADEMAAETDKVFRELVSWAQMKPDMVTLYRDTFTQPEIDGMIAFYETAVGQSMLAKMPQVVQRSMQLTAARMQPMLPRLEAISREAARRMAEAATR